MAPEPITLAVPKGRPLEPTLDLLVAAGLATSGVLGESRGLVLRDPGTGLRYILARPADVPTYVEHGAADLGIAGKDVLVEGRHQVYELLDLGYLRCRFVVAGPAGGGDGRLRGENGHLRVATKYPHVAEEYFRRRAVPAEIIYLAGSVEVAPQVGLADLIVDISETGRTLEENGLVVLDTILESTARLIANRASYRLRGAEIAPVIQALREEVERRGRA